MNLKKISPALLLPLATCYLYLLGYSRLSGATQALGANNNLIEMNYLNVLSTGFLESLFIFVIFIALCGIYFILHLLVVIKSNYKNIAFKWELEAIKWIQSRNDNIKLVGSLYIVCILAMITMSLSHYRGEIATKVALNAHIKGESKVKVSVSIDDVKRNLSVLLCGLEDCIGIEEGTNQLFIYRRPASTRIMP